MSVASGRLIVFYFEGERKMRIVVALGGNALLQRGEPLEAENLRANVKIAAKHIATVAADHELILVHGNGPQVGLLALQSEAYKKVHTYPLDVLGAESQGMIGYLLQQEIANHLTDKSVVTLLTQMLVDAKDPAMTDPSKPIGPVYKEAQVAGIKAEHPSWTMKPDGEYFRRVVPSPKPLEICELDAVVALLEGGSVVIAGGGGGVPCIQDEKGLSVGVEAVIDKDATAALIAEKVNADVFVILTDVDAIYEGWGTSDQKLIRNATTEQLNGHQFAAGSMGPKVRAVSGFVSQTGKKAMIGSLDKLEAILAGESGTLIQP
jgi:carbamate kinase